MTLDHPNYQAMLAAVLADPADDLPRLILADWLQEQPQWRECPACQGDGRLDADHRPGTIECRGCVPWGSGRVPNGYAEYGEFIRVQVELAGLPDEDVHPPTHTPGANGCGVCRQYDAFRERERVLWSSGVGKQFSAVPQPPMPLDYFVLPWERTDDLPGSVGVVRRGFVDSVALPLRLWVGKPCPGCIEPGELDDGDPRCRLCHGLGTVGGLGPDLVRRCPLTRVTLSDRAPEDGPSGYSWFKVGFADDPATLPESLFDLLSGDCSPSMLGQRLTFETRQAALDALSAACLGWARAMSLAGSPAEGR